MSAKSKLYCSFCGKSQDEVMCLIAGPTVFICDECVVLCRDITFDHRVAKALMRMQPAVRYALENPAAVLALRAASGTEAGTAETVGFSPKGDGPVAKPGARKPVRKEGDK